MAFTNIELRRLAHPKHIILVMSCAYLLRYEIIRIIALASARANWWILHIHSCGFREVRLADTRTPAEMDNDGVYEADEGLRCAVR